MVTLGAGVAVALVVAMVVFVVVAVAVVVLSRSSGPNKTNGGLLKKFSQNLQIQMVSSQRF